MRVCVTGASGKAGRRSTRRCPPSRGRTRPSAELLRDQFPGVELTRDLGEFGTLLAIDRARDELGWEPRHSWREALADPS